MTAQQIGNLILATVGALFGIFLGIYAYTEHIKHKIKTEYQKREQESHFGLRATVYDVDRGYLLTLAIKEQNLSLEQAIEYSEKLRRLSDLQITVLAQVYKARGSAKLKEQIDAETRRRMDEDDDPFAALDTLADAVAATPRDVFDPVTGKML